MKVEKFSNSSLTTYQNCPYRYYLSYVREIWPEKKAPPLVIGGAVHSVLAEMYRHQTKQFTQDKAIQVFTEALQKEEMEGNEPIENVVSDYKPIIKNILDNPLEIKPKAVEEYFRIKPVNPFTDEKLDTDFSGIIDLVSQDDAVIEHKTSKRKYTPKKIYDSFQHIGYWVAFYTLFKHKAKKVIYDVIYKSPDMQIETFDVDVEEGDVKRFFDWVHNNLKNIRNEKWDPSPSWKCAWCPYKGNICSYSKN